MTSARVEAWRVHDTGLVAVPSRFRRLGGLVRHLQGQGDRWPDRVVLEVVDDELRVSGADGAIGGWPRAEVSIARQTSGPPVHFVLEVPGGAHLLAAGRRQHGGLAVAPRVTGSLTEGDDMGDLVLAGTAGLITGGGSGIGLAAARHLLRDGASVTLAGRSQERLDAAVAELQAEAPHDATVRGVTCDVAQEDDVAHAVEVAKEATGGLQHCVASAGTGTLGPIVALPASEWDRVMDINLRGAFFTMKHAAAAMVASGGGAFVGLSSIAAPSTHPFMAAYCVSKAGLETLVRNAADELGRSNVRVNAVRPSLVPTELAAPLEEDPAVLADYLANMPVSRTGTVDDVAHLIRFLCGPESSWITGVCISVDGGHHLRRGPNVEAWARAVYGDATIDGSAKPAV